MSMWIEQLNAQRHNVSSLISISVVVLVWTWSQTMLPAQHRQPIEPMALSLQEPEPLIKSLPSTVAPVQPLKVAAPVVVKEGATSEAKPMLSIPSPVNVTPQTESVKNESPKIVSTATLVTTPLPAAEPVKAAPTPSTVQIESSYISTVRAQLNASKRYPTGREASLQRPSGKALVWFIVNRHGALLDAGIEESSNSILLDNAALSTVRRTPFNAWPEGSWPGQTQHRFNVTLDFVPIN